VIADQCAQLADCLFHNGGDFNGSTYFLGAIFFAFQIYGDFSGYSDIALGTARLFGIELLRNFAYPYFSRNMAEFWRRWHISLSTWFRDYLYVPLGGSKGSTFSTIRNTFTIFLVSGFWHGANWTFVLWGLLNALYVMPYIIFNSKRKYLAPVSEGKSFPSAKEFISMMMTFFLTVIAWVFFRAESLGHAMNYLSHIASPSFFQLPEGIAFSETTFHPGITILFIAAMIIVEWTGRNQIHGLARFGFSWHGFFRLGFYGSLALVIILFAIKGKPFIYFQF
jgi:alginate O-acetyltransferase complex protein AlgI